MSTITTTLVSGQNAHVGAVSSAAEYTIGLTEQSHYLITVGSGVEGPQGPAGEGGSNTGNITFTNTTMYSTNADIIISVSNIDPTASPAINTISNWTFGVTGDLSLPGGASIQIDGGNVDLTAGANGWAELQSNNLNSYMWVDDIGAYIGTNWTNGAFTWTFNSNGAITFPDSTTQNTAFTGNATNSNNASYLGGIAAAQYAYANQITTYTLPAANTTSLGGVKVDGTTIVISSNTISANLTNYATTSSLSSYQTTAGLSANVATLSSNNASYLGGIAAAQYAYANAIPSVAGYQTTAGLSANVATLSSNNASYLGGVAAANYLVTNTAINTGNVSVTGNITLTGNLTGNTAGFAIGYRDVPQNFTNTNYTFALTDAGKHILTQNSGSSTQTLTIANNSTVAFQTGTAIAIVVQSAGTIAIANGAGVTMYLAGNSTAKSTITLNSYSQSTLLKIGTDTWFITSTSAA